MYCRSCGQGVSDESIYCEDCGTELEPWPEDGAQSDGESLDWIEPAFPEDTPSEFVSTELPITNVDWIDSSAIKPVAEVMPYVEPEALSPTSEIPLVGRSKPVEVATAQLTSGTPIVVHPEPNEMTAVLVISGVPIPEQREPLDLVNALIEADPTKQVVSVPAAGNGASDAHLPSHETTVKSSADTGAPIAEWPEREIVVPQDTGEWEAVTTSGVPRAPGRESQIIPIISALVILALAITGLIYYRAQREPEPRPLSALASSGQWATADPAHEKLYKKVLDRYREAAADGFASVDLNGESSQVLSFEMVAAALDGNLGTACYAFHDIDGCGAPELLVGAKSEDTFIKYDLYASDGEKTYRVFDDEFGYRANFTIHPDGIIAVFGSGGASLHGWSFYGISPQTRKAVLIDSYFDDDSTYWKESVSGVEMVKKDFEDAIYRYTGQAPYELRDVIDFNWVELLPGRVETTESGND